MIVLENDGLYDLDEFSREDALRTILRGAQRYHYASLQDRNPFVASRHNAYAVALVDALWDASSEEEVSRLEPVSLRVFRRKILSTQDTLEKKAFSLLEELKRRGVPVPGMDDPVTMAGVLYGDLGASIGKKLKEAVRSVIKGVKNVVTLHRKVVRRVFKKVAPKRVQEFTSRLGKKAKRVFLKYAPWIAIAAQALNFLIPGLGILVGLAINAAAMAIQVHDARRAKKKVEKAQEAADIEASKAEKEADEKANVALMAAYDGGEKLFVDQYDMTRVKYQALSVEEKTRFLDAVIYDQHADLMEQLGVKRDDFQKMPIANQQQALAMMSQELESAPGTFTPEYEEDALPGSPSAKTISPFSSGDGNITPWIVGGAVVVMAAFLFWPQD